MQQGFMPSSADVPIVENGWKGLSPIILCPVRLRLEPPIAPIVLRHLAWDADTQCCFYKQQSTCMCSMLHIWNYQHFYLIRTSQIRSCNHDGWCQCLSVKAQVAHGWERPGADAHSFPSCNQRGAVAWDGAVLHFALVKVPSPKGKRKAEILSFLEPSHPEWSSYSLQRNATWHDRNVDRFLLWIFLLCAYDFISENKGDVFRIVQFYSSQGIV